MQCLQTVQQTVKKNKKKDIITLEPVNEDTGTHT